MRYSALRGASCTGRAEKLGTDNVKPTANDGISSRGSTRTGFVPIITANAPTATIAPAPAVATRRIHRIELYLESVKDSTPLRGFRSVS
ncbi:hypothetical protein [Mycolicibacterium sp. CBMA 226]|uniref:hypothetical protein n=1 Tax=Mycolicibacterium sp. CBMA 226 TaxID=2606611 RepID=UPI0012DE1174|nr:hypothetical protein [Mycolicibacterium sp. CBMA 226]MUL79434.1 hypothetical protein [Mycolicibacterium sp. CBMA 226]